ncbi:MAG: hypothetical protein IKR73_09735 [Oscillospiraceae bacterium]|nr:hypothetical protein [Oscillospiraceae bacterium]
MDIKHLLDIGRQAAKDPRKALRYAGSLKGLARQILLVKRSPYFDEEYYHRNNADLDHVKDVARHYLLHGRIRTPSEFFCGEEYLSLHADVKRANIEPLVHYELHGRAEGREVSYLQVHEHTFPEKAVSCERTYTREPVRHRRTAVVSCWSGDGVIPETLLILLRGLHEIADNIVLIGDCPVIPEDMDLLEGLVCYAQFTRHKQYDFGSYKRGVAYAEENGLLSAETADELILINDSCIGPVYPFSESFDRMAQVTCDFWGYSNYISNGCEYISSFFFVFRRKVLDAGEPGIFLSRVDGEYDRGRVIVTLETVFTTYLIEKGFRCELYERDNIFAKPLTFLKKYRCPLVKKKAFTRPETKGEGIEELIAIIKKAKPELSPYIKFAPPVPKDFFIPTIEEHRWSFPDKVRRIAEKYRQSGKVKVLFFINNCSLFPSRPLYDAMCKDPAFDPYIGVIPDLRWGKDPIPEMEEHEHTLLSEGIPEDRLVYIRPDDIGRWQDVTEDMDIVCYNTPYELSSFRYGHRYSVGRDFLPIMVNYGFYRSVYDDHILRMDTYRYMWKAFFECEETAAQYRRCSMSGGDNAYISGYIKMDGLAAHEPHPHQGTRILLALHHSVDGGTNDTLSLANFIRYIDYFEALPDKYPDITFVYRPHPYLFTIMRRPTLWGDEKTDAFIERMRSKSNVVWDESDDYFTAFADCDACIQDCGSFLVEYQFTNKPCCYMLKSPEDIDRKFTDLGKKCLDACYLSYTTEDIDKFIHDVVSGGIDTKALVRDAVRRRIMVNYPHAADAALENIKSELNV